MTRVLHSLWNEHKAKIASAANVDDLCSAHSSYIEANLSRCLLLAEKEGGGGSTGKKSAANRVLEFILEILGLTLEFASVYRQYLESVGYKAEHVPQPDDTLGSDSDLEDEMDNIERRKQHFTQNSEIQRLAWNVQIQDIMSRFHQQHRLLLLILTKKVEKGRFPHLEDMLIRLNYNKHYACG